MYLLREDGLDLLPDPLRRQMGKAELALSFEITPDRKLGSEDPAEVRKNLQELGYHVQIPKDVKSLLETLKPK